MPVSQDIFIRRIDLNGLAAQKAFDTTTSYVAAAKKQGVTSVVVVTGKSGTMRDEFVHWVAGNENIAKCEILPSDGAFRLTLRK